ncbi:PIG-L deacetylase family protein [Virgibacillus profundi]|nr:PIG-L family deacetylase [Virgibacillus profundi]
MKTIVFLTSVFIGLFGATDIVKADAEVKEQPTTFFIVPHQDDEMLTYGVAILNHTWHGDNVHVVLMTDGAASRVYELLNKKLDNPLTRQEFSEARLKEFKHSMMILGVPDENIHVKNYPDGGLQVADVESTILAIQKEYPNAKFKAMSYLDDHNDHKVSGLALQNLYDKGIVKDARFYFKPSQFGTERFSGAIKDKYLPEYKPFIHAGVEVYKKWQPQIGRYAIGNTSVGKSFELLKNSPTSMYHVPGYKLK